MDIAQWIIDIDEKIRAVTYGTYIHIHKWETTHVNKYYHPTKQICRGCGISRKMRFIDRDNIKGILSRNVEWIDEKGKKYKYSVLD